MIAFLTGALIAALICAMFWDWWQFHWTIRNGLRCDLFDLDPEAVREEIIRVAMRSTALGAAKKE